MKVFAGLSASWIILQVVLMLRDLNVHYADYAAIEWLCNATLFLPLLIVQWVGIRRGRRSGPERPLIPVNRTPAARIERRIGGARDGAFFAIQRVVWPGSPTRSTAAGRCRGAVRRV